MTKLETVRALNDSGQQLQIVESVRMLQQSVNQMREDLQALPSAVSTETAQALEPLDRLDRTLDQHLSIIQPLIDQATQQLQVKIEGLAQDKVKRSILIAREQHRKARLAGRSARGWREEAKTLEDQKTNLQDQKTNLQAQISQWKLRFWVATGSAATLAVVVMLMTLGRLL